MRRTLAILATLAALLPLVLPIEASASALYSTTAGAGVTYRIQRGDTLWAIAKRYHVTVRALAQANGLDPRHYIYPGQVLSIPGVQARQAEPSEGHSAPELSFAWPLQGVITQVFHDRSYNPRHDGLDIARPLWTPIRASAAGTVIRNSWYGGYGISVQIRHSGGYVTQYSHMVQPGLVKLGQWVEAGQVIGYIGVTGNTTRPHLHFMIIRNGVAQNPLNYLPRR